MGNPTELSADDLASIREWVGGSDPSNSALRKSYLGFVGQPGAAWMLVALRVLRTRLAEASAGGLTSVTVPGAIGVGLSKADTGVLTTQIEKLQALYDGSADDGSESGGVVFGRIVRTTAR